MRVLAKFNALSLLAWRQVYASGQNILLANHRQAYWHELSLYIFLANNLTLSFSPDVNLNQRPFGEIT